MWEDSLDSPLKCRITLHDGWRIHIHCKKAVSCPTTGRNAADYQSQETDDYELYTDDIGRIDGIVLHLTFASVIAAEVDMRDPILLRCSTYPITFHLGTRYHLDPKKFKLAQIPRTQDLISLSKVQIGSITTDFG